MTNEEVKELFFKRAPVMFNGSIYPRITAIIYRIDSYNKLIVSAELLDRNGRSVVIARAQDIKAVEITKVEEKKEG